MSATLTLEGVHTHIGRYHILQGVDFDAPAGRATMLLGRNGAGKTTALRTIMGLWRASRGRIALGAAPLQDLAASDVARLGVGYAPETMAVFSDLSVKENLVLGARNGPLDDSRLAWIFGFFPALRTFWLSRAGVLSGGQKQMLSIARAIIEPRELLLIDEPTKGLAPAIVGASDRLPQGHQGDRRHDPARRAEFPRGARGRRRSAGHGQWPHRPSRRDGGARRRRSHAEPHAWPQSGFPPMSAANVGAAIPRRRADILPALTPVILALAVAPFIGSLSTFATLTAAGIAMGMMIFTTASGLTLIFGLMDVLNFGHGAFIALGAYVASLILLPFASWSLADSLPANLAIFFVAVIAAALVCGAFGWVFERLIVKPVYGQHLKQILATIGGSIIAQQLLYAVFGPAQIPLPLPKSFEGSFVAGGAAIEKYRVLATLVGLAVFIGEILILNRTRLGLLIRAGVENREMVEALGYRVDRLLVGVFMAGSALAGLGGAMMALYRGQVHASMGDEFLVLSLIVIIIGGLGSVGGSFVGSILVALIANYAGFLAPKVALVSNILAMVAVLLWRPRGLYPVSGR